VQCPQCDYRVGVGIASEPGECPSCGLPLMFTCEFRALTPEELRDESDRRAAITSAPAGNRAR
jgi:hypothetical protein